MKLRLVASSRDIMIFVIFAIFLLFIVSLAVVNIPHLAAEGTFAGLNPFPAFSPEYIGATLIIYFVSLTALFFSVQSYFFEFESGFGFGFEKKNTGGYSNWAKDKEIKEDTNIKKVIASSETSEYAGIPLVCNGKELWVDNGEYHNLVIGATGSGKTTNTILPSIKVLAKKGESIICTDPKGELYEKTGGLLKNRGYNIVLLNFRNPQNGNAWNPLALPYNLYKSGNQDKSIELLDDLALNILYDESSANQDPFWEKTSADYFSGLALGLFEDAKEEEININSINMIATVGEEKFGGSTYVKEYFNAKDPASAAYVNASGTIMAPSDTKGSILSVFKQKVKLFASRENLSEMLSHSDFSLDSIGKRPTAVFIIIQDEKKTYHSLATIFVKQVYETLIDVAQESGGKLPVRTNFLLDEFANMPPLKDVTTMITAARSRQIRFTMIIQNFAQLNKVYGKDDAETIKGNCGNIIYLISSELAALEEISKLCGEKKSKKDDKTASTPLVTVSDLQRMKQFDQILLRLRKNPFKTSFVPDFKIDWGNQTSPKVSYPSREKKPVQIFDIKKFVKEQKDKKLQEMMNGSNGSDPFGGNSFASAFGSSPFGGPNPFSQSSPYRPNPLLNSNPFMKDNDELQVSDLVKKIDAKLAELEKQEEEERKKAKEDKNDESKESSVVQNIYNVDNSLHLDSIDTYKKNSVESDDFNKSKQDEDIELLKDDEFGDLDINDIVINNDVDVVKDAKYTEKDSKNDIEIVSNNRAENDSYYEKEDEKDRKEEKDKIDEKIEEDEEKSNFSDDLIEIDDIEKLVNEKLNRNIINDIDENDESSDNNLKNKDSSNFSIEPKKGMKILQKDEIQTSTNTPVVHNVSGIYKPTSTIKLEDVANDDNFFDDFFDD